MAILFILLLIVMASSNIMMASDDNAADAIASRWKELSGHGEGDRNYWKGLLRPLDNDLRRYIIHYGERTGAIGDLFNPKTGESKSSKAIFFSDAGLVKGNNYEYRVTDFIYAATNHKFFPVSPTFFGYVAVTTDKGMKSLGRRDILIVWRGTVKTEEWINNARISLISAKDILGPRTAAKVHDGFLSLYNGIVSGKGSAKEQVRNALERLMNEYLHEEVSITVTGFSLGGALATLNAVDIVANEYNKPTGKPSKAFKVTAFIFAGPRVGDSTLQEEFKLKTNSGLRILRITNSRDPVPEAPPGSVYVAVGHKELTINDGPSPFLKWKFALGRSDDEDEDYFDPNSVPEIPKEGQVPDDGSERTGRGLHKFPFKAREFFSCHNMDVYLHAVAGLQNDPKRPNVKFDLDPTSGPHDYVLVNKFLNRLKPVYKIPETWWEGENRIKMVQQPNGRWKVK